MSLNDHMFTGPTLQSDLPLILLIWRLYRYAFTSEIVKMYRQILVNLLDVWCQCILWRHNLNALLEEHCLLTVTYGTRSTPFLALRVLPQFIEDEGNAFPVAPDALKYDKLFVDILFGAHDKAYAMIKRKQLIDLLAEGKL
ncbi:uncharacterized protein LOC117180424 [Belonocnema kinseyi]|uniref:uncharacterized protein LOC117180424 n=1 Tax=Belonocnema kinseyi TaxID=2817044 RepID=UPI00143DB37A|nr:uncharacterized protein LOC117180424 [Belonocnema kinseyi]